MAKTSSETITDPQDRIFREIDSSSDMFVEKLRALCKQPSVSAQNLGLDETAELVGKFLKEFGFTVAALHLPEGDFLALRHPAVRLDCGFARRLGPWDRNKKPVRLAKATPAF